MECRLILYGAVLAAAVSLGAVSGSAVPISPSSLLPAVESSDFLVNVARRGGHAGASRNVNCSGNVNRNRNVNVNVNRSVGVVRPFVRRPYYGTVVAGVTLGTIIVASTVPAAPSSDLCWYWSSSSHTRGSWDYCVPY